MKRVLMVVVVGLIGCIGMPTTWATPGQQSGLVLSNTLGSKYRVNHSLVGPNLSFCQTTPACGGEFNVNANPAFVTGRPGTAHAITIGPGSYGPGDREQNVVLTEPAAVLDPEHGTISVWFEETAAPVGVQYGVYRIFSGAYGLNSGIQLWVDATSGGRLQFDVGATDPSTAVAVDGLNSSQPGIGMSSFIGRWIHITARWDQNGIGASGQTLQVWINGIERGAATATGWSGDVGTAVDIASGNDGQIAGKFFEEDLAIYSTSS